ncbi:MAG: VWA domain-containing protein [Candidatus Cloacimonetes bacterium]|nr:VWA domain-containing protein [Candidatus Cloacimonadota bacterium]
MKRQFLSILMILFLFIPALFQAKENTNPHIEMAILLDTSGSMEGLIEQAKSQLWRIVNELALSRRDGKTIELFVALYEYGKDSLPAEEGYMKMICPLTGDLDKISEELFILETNGGDEYCGQVINRAVQELTWSPDNQDLKLIFIAGNEPFTQGKVDYREACKNAISKGIIVNTIFCGDFQEGIETSWKDGAVLADGTYMNIDQNMEVVDIAAPQDEELLLLGNELNGTYIAYGDYGSDYKERQEEQDSNAMTMSGGTMIERVIAKSSSQYRNEAWDLVDAEEEGAVNIAELDAELLPEIMKDMTPTERQQYVDDMGKKREEIQNRIQELNEARRKYIAQERSKIQDKTLDSAMLEAIRLQAEKKNYSFE